MKKTKHKLSLIVIMVSTFVLLTGCAVSTEKPSVETPKSQQVEENTQSNIPISTYDGPKVNIGQKVGPGVIEFISNAELTYLNLTHSTDSHDKPIVIGNYGYLKPFPPLDTKAGILNYFEAYWSPEISNRMFENLGIKIVNGKCYVLAGDPPFNGSMIKEKTNYVDQKEDVITIDSFYQITLAETDKVTYKLKWVGDNWIIIDRAADSSISFPYGKG